LYPKIVFFASIDLRDAYYSLPIAEEFRKYLKFQWRNQLYCFQAAAMGLSPVPRIFTKLTKPILAQLHESGHMITSFIDDSLLVGNSKLEIMQSVTDTVRLFDSLGFTVHDEKSQFVPTQLITYLGFVIDSRDMSVKLTKEREQKLFDACTDLIQRSKTTIRAVASCIGQMVASLPGVPLGQLHYRKLERSKNAALSRHKGNWDRPMSLSATDKAEIQWWLDNLTSQRGRVRVTPASLCLHTDASGIGWGAVCSSDNKNEETNTQGLWTESDKQLHINHLELKAVWLSLKSLLNHVTDVHILVRSDNTTVVSCINHMGSSKSESLDLLTRDIWQWCIDRNNWISCAHIAGIDNTRADELSRHFHLDTEWKLDSSLLSEALQILGTTPNIDLFASSLNYQMTTYVSFQPDPFAYATDAFSLEWRNFSIYCFPPFSLLARVLRKIITDKAEGVVVVPFWRNQVFWPMLARMLIQKPVLLSSREQLLTLPSDAKARHPLRKKLQLVVCNVSGNSCKNEDFLKTLPILSCGHGVHRHKECTMCILKSGVGTQVRDRWIPFRRL
jgi:hypothetical protein